MCNGLGDGAVVMKGNSLIGVGMWAGSWGIWIG